MADHWNGMVWGTSPIAILLFSVWLSLGVPPAKLVVIGFVWALIVAGYYTWRADHLRLMPRLEFAPRVFVEPNSTIHSVVHYYQVLPRCLTDAVVEQCRGYLLRVMKWEVDHWEPTALNETLDLMWSFHDSAPRVLEYGVDRRLNVFCVDDNHVMLSVEEEPLKARPGVHP
jgi:hypothetical protein